MSYEIRDKLLLIQNLVNSIFLQNQKYKGIGLKCKFIQWSLEYCQYIYSTLHCRLDAILQQLNAQIEAEVHRKTGHSKDITFYIGKFLQWLSQLSGKIYARNQTLFLKWLIFLEKKNLSNMADRY